MVIYNPASSALRRFRGGKGTFRDTWERVSVEPLAWDHVESGEPPTGEVAPRGDDALVLVVWPGMRWEEARAAWRSCMKLLKGRRPEHLAEYSGYLRGKALWERRYLGGQRVESLREAPTKTQRRSWKQLSDENGTTVEAIKQAIVIFKRHRLSRLPERALKIAEALDRPTRRRPRR